MKVDLKQDGVKELKTFKDLRKRIYKRTFSFVDALNKLWSWRRKDIVTRALMFCKQNRDVLVIIADPAKDDMIAAYKNSYSVASIPKEKFAGLVKTNQRIIKTIIERKGTPKENDIAVDKLLQFIDAFLYNFHKNYAKKKVAESPSDNGEENKKDLENGKEEKPSS